MTDIDPPPLGLVLLFDDVWSQACNVSNRNSIQNFNREIYMRIFKVLYAAANFSHRKCKLCLSSPLPSIATFSCWLPSLLSLPLPPSTLLTSQPPVLIFPSSLLLSSSVEHFPSNLFNSLHILCFVCCHILLIQCFLLYDLLLSLVQQRLTGSQSQNVSTSH